MNDIYYAVLAGGSGKRLWPLSSPKRPKQLVPFINGTTLLEQTIQRVQHLVKSKNHLVIVTNSEQQEAIKKVVGKQATVLAEPCGRNTGPALLLACLEIYEKNSDAVIVSLPSDHFIPDSDKFSSMLLPVTAFASCYDQIVLLGVKPTHAATGYGYIQYKVDDYIPGWKCFPVEKFHEKPDKETALAYSHATNMLWNIGVFAGKVRVILQAFEQHAPDLWRAMQQYKKGELAYEHLVAQSFDCAVLEKNHQSAVFQAEFEWHDVGTLTSFLTLKTHYQKADEAAVISVMGSGNLACANKKTVAFVGVSNLCLVETDDVIVVVDQNHVEAVRDMLPALTEKESCDGVAHKNKPTESALTAS